MIQAGDFIHGEIVGGSNQLGYFNVSIGGSSPFLKVPVAHRKDQYFVGMDCVLGFINTDSPIIVSRGFKRTLPTFSTPVTTNTYPWQCRLHDSFNSNRSSYEFSYSAGSGTAWEYTIPTVAENLCVALVNDTDYILIPGEDRALCIDENGNLIWETFLPNPGVSGTSYSYHGFISDNKFHSVRGWFYPIGNNISISIDRIDIETGALIDQIVKTWQIGSTAFFSAEVYYIKASNNDTSYSLPINALLPLSSSYESAIFTQNDGFENAPSNTLFNVDTTLVDTDYSKSVAIDDNIYVAARMGNSDSGDNPDSQQKIVMFDKDGNYLNEHKFAYYYSDIITGWPPVIEPATVTRTTTTQSERIQQVKAYRSSDGNTERIFVLTKYYNTTSINRYYYDTPTPYIDSDSSVTADYHTKLYIFNSNLTLLQTVDYEYYTASYTNYYHYGTVVSSVGSTSDNYGISSMRVVVDADDGYSIQSYLTSAGGDPILAVAINDSGAVTTITDFAGSPADEGLVFDVNGGFIDSSGQIRDVKGNILETKTIGTPTEVVAGKNGVYLLYRSSGKIYRL